MLKVHVGLDDYLRLTGHPYNIEEKEDSLVLTYINEPSESFTLTINPKNQCLVITANKVSVIETAMPLAMVRYMPDGAAPYRAVPILRTDKFLSLPYVQESTFRGLSYAGASNEGMPEISLEIPKRCEYINYLKKVIKKFVTKHGIEYPEYDCLNLELRYLTSPVAKGLNKPYMPFEETSLMEKCGITTELELCETFEEIVKSIFGVSTPKLIKLAADRIFSHKTYKSATPPHRAIYNMHSAAVATGQQVKVQYLNDDTEVFEFDMGFISFARMMVKLFGVDKAYNILILAKKTFADAPYDDYQHVYESFFKELGYEYTLKIISRMERLYSTFFDTVWMWENYREGKLSQKLIDKGFKPLQIPRKCKNIEEIHNRLLRPYTEIKEFDEFKFFSYKQMKKHGFLKQLHKTKYGKYDILLPNDSKDMVHWGRTLKNCIASYSDRVYKDQTCVIALAENGVLFAGVEVRVDAQLTLVQYRTYGDKCVGDEEKMKFHKFVMDKLSVAS